TFTSDKLESAFLNARSANASEPRVYLSVPASEAAAIVSVPVNSLSGMANQAVNPTFAVQFKNICYELPLKSLDYVTLGQLIIAGGGSGNLLIEIDSGQDSTTAS